MSDAHFEPVVSEQAAGAGASVGDILRGARESRAETLGDVAYALKLTSRQVEAMEAGRFELLPGPAFVRGFVRNYARYLGIDPSGLMASLNQDLASSVVELAPVSNADGVMPNGAESRSMLVPAVVLASGLALALLAGWYFDWFQAPPENGTVAGTAGPDAVVEGQPLIVEPELIASEPEPGDALAPSWVEGTPTPTPTPPSAGEIAPDAAAGTAQVPVSDEVTSAEPEPPPLPAEAAVAAPVVPDTADPLVFRFRGKSWVEVRDAEGRILFSGVNAPGSTRTVQGSPPFALVVGNARDVSVEYRGQPVELSSHVRASVARLTVK